MTKDSKLNIEYDKKMKTRVLSDSAFLTYLEVKIRCRKYYKKLKTDMKLPLAASNPLNDNSYYLSDYSDLLLFGIVPKGVGTTKVWGYIRI